MISPENLSLLIQLLNSEEDAVRELEKQLEKKDNDKFSQVKQELAKFQKQISEILKSGY